MTTFQNGKAEGRIINSCLKRRLKKNSMEFDFV